MKPSDITLLMTRPRPASERFAAQLETAVGPFGQRIVSPILDIVPLPSAAEFPPGAIPVFTSENAVAVAARLFGRIGGLAYCVGDRTAVAAAAAGFDAVSAGGDVSDLVALLAERPPEAEVIHLSGRHQTGDLAERLVAEGIRARRVEIYDQAAQPLSRAAQSAIAGGAPVLLPLFSPRSARLVASGLDSRNAPLLIAALSPAVMAAWRGPVPASAVTAPHPTAAALVGAIAGLLARLPSA